MQPQADLAERLQRLATHEEGQDGASAPPCHRARHDAQREQPRRPLQPQQLPPPPLRRTFLRPGSIGEECAPATSPPSFRHRPLTSARLCRRWQRCIGAARTVIVHRKRPAPGADAPHGHHLPVAHAAAYPRSLSDVAGFLRHLRHHNRCARRAAHARVAPLTTSRLAGASCTRRRNLWGRSPHTPRGSATA